MQPHYFHQAEPDADDIQLMMAKGQGYVPSGCLLGGVVVMAETAAGRKACWGCNGPRERCSGAPKRTQSDTGERQTLCADNMCSNKEPHTQGSKGCYWGTWSKPTSSRGSGK